jgi:hypothetical protein
MQEYALSIRGIEHLKTPADRTHQEIGYSVALEYCFGQYERLVDLHNAASRCREDLLDQLERYRDGLGALARHASDVLIDIECKELGLNQNVRQVPVGPPHKPQ